MPAQMTDIVTQLAGGQSPFLIAIQQGGQMRDSFGGFGNMFKGIAASISPFKLAMAGAVGAIGAVGYAMYAGAKEGREFENVLTLSGDRAGITADRLQVVADTVGGTTGSFSAAREAVMAFAAEGRIARDDYADFATSVSLMSQATGKDVSELVGEFTKIGDDPVKAVVELSGKYKSMTADVYAQVTALKEQGKEQEAVRLVQKLYADETADMAKKVTENLGWIERVWKNIKEESSGAWEVMKSWGRDSTFSEQIAKLERANADLSRTEAEFGVDMSKERAANNEKIAMLKREMRVEEELSEQKRAKQLINENAVKSMDNLRRGAESALPAIAKLRQELQKIDEDLANVRAGGDKKTIADAEKWAKAQKASINEKIQAEQDKERKAAEREKQSAYRGTPMARLSSNQKRLYELAKQSGEDPAKWLALYQIESRSGNDLINESSGATGHFQIMPQFFKDYGVSRAGAMDLATSFHAVRKHHARASASLRQKLGRDLTAGEYYLGHQQGWGGAKALLSNPDMNVVDALATIMSRGRAQAQVLQNGGRTSMTARQFAGMWVGKANKLQQQFGGKGVGSLDSSSAAGLYEKWDMSAKIPKKSDYEQYLEQNAHKQLRTQIERELRANGKHRVIENERDLRSRPEFASWIKEQQNSELAKARAADEAATHEKYKQMADEQMQILAQKHAMIGKSTELARLQYETESGSLKHLSVAEKNALISKQAMIEAAQKQFDIDGKYADLIGNLSQKMHKQRDDAAFELSLVGKTKSEIEKLTLAREYDLHIMQAISDGASLDWIKSLELQKETAELTRQEIEKMQKAHGENWLAGISDGMTQYVGSFKSMREEMSGLVAQTASGFSDQIANFVATGKANFREFSQSIIQDISKMMIKMAIFNAMKAAGQSMSGAGGWVGAIGSAISGGFSDGGYTGHGGKFEPAGIVHKGEYVLSQENLRALGGVSVVESLLHRAKGYSSGGLVGGGVGILAHTKAAQSAAPVINITVNVSGSNKDEARAGAQEGIEAAIPQLVQELADMRIAEHLRPNGMIFNMMKA
nr:phage tail length tape measure family protein [Alysiella crassa]UOP08215.1 phage tail length tape measure family protein [Alysiella crassa]